MTHYQALHEQIDCALADSAELAWRMAPQWCFRVTGDGVSCEPYHRVWQYLLLLGATSSLRTDTRFLVDTLRGVFREHARARVLVCGAADYGTLAHVLHAAQCEAATPEVVVIDRCQTPLELNRWYADRLDAVIDTRRMDILDNAPQGPFDVICTHSFLGWVSPTDRIRLLRTWRDVLQPGGIVVTTKRLRDTPDTQPRPKFGAEEAQQFARRVGGLAQRDPSLSDQRRNEIAQAALAYAQAHVRHPLRTREELIELFDQGGFDMQLVGDSGVPGEADKPSGPGKGAGVRLRIVARRRP